MRSRATSRLRALHCVPGTRRPREARRHGATRLFAAARRVRVVRAAPDPAPLHRGARDAGHAAAARPDSGTRVLRQPCRMVGPARDADRRSGTLSRYGVSCADRCRGACALPVVAEARFLRNRTGFAGGRAALSRDQSRAAGPARHSVGADAAGPLRRRPRAPARPAGRHRSAPDDHAGQSSIRSGPRCARKC